MASQGKIICTQTSHLSPLPVFVGAENGNQVNTFLFNGSLGERGGSQTGDRDAGWRGKQGETGEKEAMEPGNGKGVGKRQLDKGGHLSPSTGIGWRETGRAGGHTGTCTQRHKKWRE